MGVTVLPHGVLARVREVLLDSVEHGLTHSKCGLLSRWLLAVTCERFDGPGWEGSSGEHCKANLKARLIQALKNLVVGSLEALPGDGLFASSNL